MSVAFLFPGQGSQSLGMLSDFSQAYPLVEEIFSEASDALGYDLWAIVKDGPVEKLNETTVTQPAILTASVALWRIWVKEGGPLPSVMAGHSLGEYSALLCAGAFNFSDTVSLVADRGKYMQEAVPPGEGAMAAILGLDNDKVVAACVEAAKGEIVAAVNFNSPGQVVIAGQTDAVNRAMQLCKETGAKRALPLPVSVPSHCQLMEPAAHYLAERLQNIEISRPDIKMLNNVDVSSEDEPAKIQEALIRQLCNPVRWVDIINKMSEEGVSVTIECGPGNVLTGLNKRINRTLVSYSIDSPESMEKALKALQEG